MNIAALKWARAKRLSAELALEAARIEAFNSGHDNMHYWKVYDMRFDDWRKARAEVEKYTSQLIQFTIDNPEILDVIAKWQNV